MSMNKPKYLESLDILDETLLDVSSGGVTEDAPSDMSIAQSSTHDSSHVESKSRNRLPPHDTPNGGGGLPTIHQSTKSHHSQDYDLHRASLENEYLRKINSQLYTKLNSPTSKSEVDSLLAVVPDDFDLKPEELEWTNKKVAEVEKEHRAELDALKVEQRAMDGMVNELRDLLEVACRQRDDARKHVATLTADKDVLANKVFDTGRRSNASSITTELQTLKSEVTMLESQMASVTSEKKHIEKKYKKAAHILDKTMRERDKIYVKYKKKEELAGSVAQMSTKLVDAIGKKAKHWEDKYKSSTKALDEVQAERDDLKLSMVRQSQQGLNEKVDTLSNVGGKSEQRTKNLERELIDVRSTLITTNKEKSELLKSKRAMTEEINTLESEVDKITAEKEADVEELQQELASLRERLDDSEEKAEKLTADLKSARDLLKIAETSMQTFQDDLKAALTERDKVRKDMTAKLEEKELLPKQLSAKIVDLEADLLESRQNEERLACSVKSLEISHTEEVSRLEDEKKEAIQDLEKKMDGIIEESFSAMDRQLRRATLEKEASFRQAEALSVALAASKRAGLSADIHPDDAKIPERRLSEIVEESMGPMNAQLNKAILGKEENAKKAKALSVALANAKKEQQDLEERVHALQVNERVLVEKERERSEEMKQVVQQVPDAELRLQDSEASMQQEIDSLQRDLAEVTAAKDTEVANLQKELETAISARDELLAEKNSIPNETFAISRNMNGDLSAANGPMQQDMSTELHGAKNAAMQEQERLNTTILSLEEDLLESKQNEKRLAAAIKSLEVSHAGAMARGETSNGQDLEQKMDCIIEESLSAMDEQLKRTISEKEEHAKRGEMLSLELAVAKAEKKHLEERVLALEATKNHGGGEERERYAQIEQVIQQVLDAEFRMQESEAFMQREMDSLQNELAAITVAKAAEVANLEKQLESATAARDKLLAERESMQNNISSLEADLPRQQEEMLASDGTTPESSHAEQFFDAEAVACVVEDENKAIKQKEDTTKKEKSPSSVIDTASPDDNERDSKITSLEADLTSLEANLFEQIKQVIQQVDDANLESDRGKAIGGAKATEFGDEKKQLETDELLPEEDCDTIHREMNSLLDPILNE